MLSNRIRNPQPWWRAKRQGCRASIGKVPLQIVQNNRQFQSNLQQAVAHGQQSAYAKDYSLRMVFADSIGEILGVRAQEDPA